MSIEQRIMESIAEQTGKDVTVEYTEIEKNNGNVRRGFSIKECGSTLGMTIYLNDNDIDIEEHEDEIVQQTVGRFSEAIQNPPDFADLQSVFTKEYILQNVRPALVNADRNVNRFDSLINRKYVGDLSIIYKVIIKNSDGEDAGTVTLTRPQIEMLEMTEDELHEAAIANVQGQGVIKSLEKMLDTPTPLVIITNESCMFGASCILDEVIIEELKKREGITYIIPSSVHELLVVPPVGDDDVQVLSQMIRAVNATLSPEDYLSDSLFRFTAENGFEKVEVA